MVEQPEIPEIEHIEGRHGNIPTSIDGIIIDLLNASEGVTQQTHIEHPNASDIVLSQGHAHLHCSVGIGESKHKRWDCIPSDLQ